jgi:signal transduction protein with GAF and PtsI domain
MANVSTDTQDSNRLKRLERELDAARRISQALFQHLDLETLVQQAHQIALEVVDAQAGCVLLAKPETKELVFYHAIGEKAPPMGTAFPWDQGIAGSVFQTGEPVVTGDAKQDNRHFKALDQSTGYTTNDMIALPLKRWEGDPIGVMEIMNKRTGRLNEEDVAILTIISAMTAISIEEARLFEEAKLAEVVRVLGDIGHDVKNLLMPVLCGAALLKTEVDEVFTAYPQVDESKAQGSYQMCTEVIEMLQNNARRIQDRVKEIADCVKGLSSPPTFAPCRMSEVVNGVIETLRFVAEENRQQCDFGSASWGVSDDFWKIGLDRKKSPYSRIGYGTRNASRNPRQSLYRKSHQ